MPEVQSDAVRAATLLIAATLSEQSAGPTELSAALAALGVEDADRQGVADHAARARLEHGRLRRREHELAALFSSARELAEVGDADAVLHRLVLRAHEMMASDLTYLSEFDATTRELRVRTTSGSVSPQFKSLIVPPGRGLASEIVESRAPRWSARYEHYRSDLHAQGIDDAVAAEGIVSLLGVPMLTNDEVLGVLFVANRNEHSFTPEEVALLAALADHASVVLQNARTLQNLQRSEEESRQALERLTAHLIERDRANVVHQDLLRAVLAGGGFAPVTETLSAALGRPVTLIDHRGKTLSLAGSARSAALLVPDDPVSHAIAQSRRSGHCVAVEGDGAVQAVAALTAGPQYFGSLLFGSGEVALGPVELRTIERAAQVGALLALQQEAIADTEHRMRSELVADLLDHSPERRSSGARRAQQWRLTTEQLDTVVLFDVPDEARATVARALERQLHERALVGEHRGYVVALIASDDADSDPEEIRVQLGRSIPHPITVVLPPPSHGSLPSAFELALRTASLLSALGISDVIASTADFLPYSAVLDTDPRTLALFLDDTIGAVSRYDAARGAELLVTLRAFVRNGASPTRTARALHFHTNTILQRLERLDHVLGSDWRDDERLFRIGIAIRLDELREKLLDRQSVI